MENVSTDLENPMALMIISPLAIAYFSSCFWDVFFQFTIMSPLGVLDASSVHCMLDCILFVTGVFCLYEQKRTCPGMENCGKPLSNFCTNLASLWQKICHLYPGLCATKFQTHFTPKIVRMIIDMYVEPIFHGFIAAHWHLWSTLPGGRLPTSHRCWPPAIFVRLSRLLAYFNAQTPGLATARFDLPDHQFGTASPPIVATLISL